MTRTHGAAITRGETLFEIAPSDDYEVHVLVDEADVQDVFEGQSGELSLRASPGEALPLQVSAVHPVAEAEAGASRFRVRASLSTTVSKLHPGQSGVARLDAGHLSAFGAVTRRLNRHLSELWWRYLG